MCFSCHTGVSVWHYRCSLSYHFSCSRHEEPLPTDPIFWPCLHISQTGPLSCSVSVLYSASAETTSTPSFCQPLFSATLMYDEILLSMMFLPVREIMLTFFRLDPSSALDFLWACSHIPRIWQGRDQKISQVRSKAHIKKPLVKVTLCFSWDRSQGEFIMLKLMTHVLFFFVCAEENGEVRAATELGGAHQPGGPDPVRVGAQQSRFASRWQKQLGPGLLFPYPVQASPPSLLLQWRSRKHQESLRVPHQLHKEMGGQVRCILLFQHSPSTFFPFLSHPSIFKDTYAPHIFSYKVHQCTQAILFDILYCSF